MPSGPGFRLRRNHAKGAFPPFGFNPITQGRRRTFREKLPSGWGGSLGSRSRSPRQPHDEVRLSVRFDGRGGSAPGSSDHLLGEVVHAAPQTVFRPHRARQHRRRSDEAVPANAPLVSYELALTVRVEKTAPKATGAPSPIPARRRTAAIAVFPRFPETGAPSASSIGTV